MCLFFSSFYAPCIIIITSWIDGSFSHSFSISFICELRSALPVMKYENEISKSIDCMDQPIEIRRISSMKWTKLWHSERTKEEKNSYENHFMLFKLCMLFRSYKLLHNFRCQNRGRRQRRRRGKKHRTD